MNSKWELVLIEWVNCLKMGKPIEDLKSLKDGEFLSNFMNVLLRTQLAIPNIIPRIRKFIKAEYPSLNFNLTLSTDSLNNLSSQELMPLLSILMHHSCVVNPREIITTPMCYHISKGSQIYIKQLLEEINCSIGDVDLNEVINKCLSIKDNSSVNQWISSAGDSPLLSCTPLKEYLQTPFKTRFLTEKEHEIKKLRTCLELESFEKTDLLEELKEHKEKIEHLKQQIKGKSQEVSKLRNELFDAQTKDCPRSVKKKYDLTHQLRAEITDLEKYTHQLQQEQEELQIEKNGSDRKLKKAETELKAANEKTFSLETVCDLLTEKHNDQNLELETLRSNCSELHLLLSELRGVNHNNSSFLDMSQDVTSTNGKRRSNIFNDTASCEDLACSVIEVQLREAQDEIVNLKKEISNSVAMNREISADMDSLKIDYDEVQKKLEVSEVDTTKLNTKLDELKRSFEDLQDIRQQLLDNVRCVNADNSRLSGEVDCLNKTNSDISVKLELTVCEITALKRKLAETESETFTMKSLNDMTCNQLIKLKEEAENLERNVNQKASELTDSNCKLKSMEAMFASLDTKFEKNLRKFEEMLLGSNVNHVYHNKNDIFEGLLQEFERITRVEFQNKEELRTKLRDFELVVNAFEKIVDDLKLKALADFEFSEKLKEGLKETELKQEVLAKTIGDKDELIDKLRQDLNEMERTVNELNVLKEKFAQQEKELKLRKAMTERSLINFTRDLENVNKTLEGRTIKPVREIGSEDSDLSEPNEDLKQIKKSLSENEKSFLKEASKINENIAAIIVELEDRNVELKTYKENYNSIHSDLEEVQKKYAATKKELRQSEVDFKAKITILEETTSGLKKTLFEESQDKLCLDYKYDQLSKESKKLIDEKDSYVAKSEALLADMKSLAEKVILTEKLCEDKDDVLMKTSQELLIYKLELAAKKQEMSELKVDLNNLHVKMNVSKTEMVQQQEEIGAHKMKIDVLQKEIEFLDGLKEDLAKKNKDLEENNLHIISQLSLKNKEYDECIEDIKKNKLRKEQEILNLKQSLKKSNEEILDLEKKFSSTSAKYDREIITLNQKKEKLVELISVFESKEKSYLQDIRQIKNYIATLVSTTLNLAKDNNITGLLETFITKNGNFTMEEINDVFQKLNATLVCVQIQTNTLQTDIKKCKLALADYKQMDEENANCFDMLTTSQNVLEQKLENKQNDLVKLREKMKDLKLDFSLKQRESATNLILKERENAVLEEAMVQLKENLIEKDEITADFKARESDFKSKTYDLEEQVKEKTKQLELLHENCKQLQSDTDELKKRCATFEEIEVEKNKLEEVLSNKEGIIEELRLVVSSTQSDFDLTKTRLGLLESQLSEKVSELVKVSTDKSTLNIKLMELENSLEKFKNERDALLDSRRQILEDTEINIRSAHENAVQLKKDLEERLNSAQMDVLEVKNVQEELEQALKAEICAKEDLQLRILELGNEKVTLEQFKFRYHSLIFNLHEVLPENMKINVKDDSVLLEDLCNQIERQIIDVIESRNDLTRSIADMREEQKTMASKVFSLEEVQAELSKEKEQLLQKFENMRSEKWIQNQQKYEALFMQYELLKTKYEQYESYSQINEKKHVDTEIKLQKMTGMNQSITDNYTAFKQKYHDYKVEIETVLKNRNLLEATLNNLSEKISSLQSKAGFVNEEAYKTHFEKKRALEIINTDLQKQFLRCTKITHNVVLNFSTIIDIATQKIIAGDVFDYENFDELTLNETKQKFEEIKEFSEDALQRVDNFVVPAEKAMTNILKESNRNVQSVPSKDMDDLKKKFSAMKQKLILVENAKNNYEKKIHSLREENNKLIKNTRPAINMDSEAHYNTLLLQHLQTKEEHEALITECEAKHKQLLREFENYKKDHPIVLELSTNSQTQRISKSLQDRSSKLEREVYKLRDAYGNLMSDKSKLELENITIKKILDDRNAQIGDLTVVKDAYEKLLENNNKLATDIDTLQYKRTRDREEFVRILKNEKDEYENREGKRIQDIRNEYELKLEKMKDKMVKLYKEEVDKEMQKAFSEKSNNSVLMETIEQLREELTSTQLKLELISTERSSAVVQLHQAQSELSHYKRNPQQTNHIHPQQQHRIFMVPNDNLLDSLSGHLFCRDSLLRSDNSLLNRGRDGSVIVEDRRCATMPKNGGGVDMLQEIRIQKRTSICANGVVPANSASQLEMEDEDDMFNNKYLTDLKEGRCNPSVTSNTRMSELVYRNSMCLPHLKSSYPCETQFTSPSVIKENDIKLGSNTITPPTSTTTRHSYLPPPHPHQRPRKDAGTTSYKRPGPPTPSKNGGRASLNSMDRVQGAATLPLREINDGRASIAASVVQQARSRLTPTRLKSLFTTKAKGANASVSGGSTISATELAFASIVCQCKCHTTVTLTNLANQQNSHKSITKFWTKHTVIIGLIRRLFRQRYTVRSDNCARDYHGCVDIWWQVAKHMLFLTCLACASAVAVQYFHGGEDKIQGCTKLCCRF